MKNLNKLFSICILATAMLSFTFQSNAQNTAVSGPQNYDFNSLYSSNSVKEVKISITVDWGRKSRECRGFGICGFIIDIEFDILSSVFTFRQPNRDNLDLYITEEGLKKMKDVINGETLIIKENYTIDIEQSKKLGFSSEYIIQSGKYQLSYDKETGSYKVKL